MNDLLKAKMFSLLSEPSQVTNEEMHNAYGCFMEHMKVVSQSEQDYAVIYRNLSATRIEFTALELINRYEQGEKCPEICLS